MQKMSLGFKKYNSRKFPFSLFCCVQKAKNSQCNLNKKKILKTENCHKILAVTLPFC